MVLIKVPWATGNMAENTHGLARQAFFDSTGGAEGISSVGALKVQAQTVPNGTVRVAPGGAILNNRYDLSLGQSYGARNASQTSVTITATGSAGGRTDAILLRILDPEFEGQPPTNPNAFDYTRLVAVPAPAGITRIEQLNLTYPAILLARVTIPANTGTITNAMITDLRIVARPQRQTEWRTFALTPGQGAILSATSSYPVNGQTWPVEVEAAWGEIDIPTWATRMKIAMFWAGVSVPSGDAHGWLWVQVGRSDNPANVKTQGTWYDGANAQNPSRTMYLAPDQIAVPAALRGTSQRFYPRGNVVGGSVASRLRLDGSSSMMLQVEFMEQAD